MSSSDQTETREERLARLAQKLVAGVNREYGLRLFAPYVPDYEVVKEQADQPNDQQDTSANMALGKVG